MVTLKKNDRNERRKILGARIKKKKGKHYFTSILFKVRRIGKKDERIV